MATVFYNYTFEMLVRLERSQFIDGCLYELGEEPVIVASITSYDEEMARRRLVASALESGMVVREIIFQGRIPIAATN